MVTTSSRTLVWDLPVRLGHWLMALGFVVAWLTAESERWRLVHVMSGTVVLAVVSFRLVWGFVGSHHARFASFVCAPKVVLRYLGALRHDGHQACLGHNPAGGWSVLALLAGCLGCGLTGLATYNEWSLFVNSELHEWIGQLSLALVGIHLAGVFLSSFIHRENLVSAMLTGYKPWASPQKEHSSHHWLAAIVMMAWAGALTYWIGVLP
jgi:cytochrome b